MFGFDTALKIAFSDGALGVHGGITPCMSTLDAALTAARVEAVSMVAAPFMIVTNASSAPHALTDWPLRSPSDSPPAFMSFTYWVMKGNCFGLLVAFGLPSVMTAVLVNVEYFLKLLRVNELALIPSGVF